jgi:hypothetical protein
MGLDTTAKVLYYLGVKGTPMKQTATAVMTPPAPVTETAEAHWMTYKDRPATMNLQEMAVWMLTNNPSMAVSILMGALEENATLPTGTDGKLVEVTVWDEQGNPEYNLTEQGQYYYDQTVPE